MLMVVWFAAYWRCDGDGADRGWVVFTVVVVSCNGNLIALYTGKA